MPIRRRASKSLVSTSSQVWRYWRPLCDAWVREARVGRYELCQQLKIAVEYHLGFSFFYSISWFKLCAPIIELSCSYISFSALGSFNRYSIFRRFENSLMWRKHERQRADNWRRRIFHITKTRLQKLTFRSTLIHVPWQHGTVALKAWLDSSDGLVSGSGWLQTCVDMSGSLYL